MLYPEAVHWRPATRAQCIDGPRPCPWVGCKYNLFIDVSNIGSIRYNFPGIEPGDIQDSCTLDVVRETAGEGITLEEVGMIMNLTRERVRQIEDATLRKLSKSVDRKDLE